MSAYKTDTNNKTLSKSTIVWCGKKRYNGDRFLYGWEERLYGRQKPVGTGDNRTRRTETLRGRGPVPDRRRIKS